MREHISSETLSAYLDKALDETAICQVEQHLPHCAACRQQLEELAQLVSVLHQRPDFPEQPFFAARLMARIKAQQERDWVDDFVWITKRLVPGFAILLAAILTWNTLRPEENPATLDDYLAAAETAPATSFWTQNENDLTKEEVLQVAVFAASTEE